MRLLGFFLSLLQLSAGLAYGAGPEPRASSFVGDCRRSYSSLVEQASVEFQTWQALPEETQKIQDFIQAVRGEFGLNLDTLEDLKNIRLNYDQKGGVLYLLKDQKGKLAGTGGFFAKEGAGPSKTAILSRVYLDPAQRGKGLGENLVKRLIEDARQKGFKRMELKTDVRLQSAIRLYEKLGFHKIESSSSDPAKVYYELKLE